MEIRSFNSIWIRYQESIIAYKDYRSGCRKPYGKLQQQHLDRLMNAVKHFEKKLLKFGEGSVVKVTGTQNKYDKVTKLFVEKPFEMTFTGITIDDTKEYINTLVKLDILKVNLSTIHYYIIKTGIHLLTKPIINYE